MSKQKPSGRPPGTPNGEHEMSTTLKAKCPTCGSTRYHVRKGAPASVQSVAITIAGKFYNQAEWRVVVCQDCDPPQTFREITYAMVPEPSRKAPEIPQPSRVGGLRPITRDEVLVKLKKAGKI